MKRLLALLVALLVAWLAGPAEAVPGLAAVSHAYSYDCRHVAATSAYGTTTESGTGVLAGSDSYSYDAVQRMKKAGGSSYTFDAGDRLTSIGGPAMSYAGNGNGRVTSWVQGNQELSYSYTNGNRTETAVTSGSGKTIDTTFDGGNRMTRAVVNNTAYDYAYDGDNLRVARTTGGATTRYAYDRSSGVPELLSEGDLDYVYAPDGLPIEQIKADGSDAAWFTHDQHGDTRILANASGAVGAAYSYSPYGEATRTQGTGSTTLTYGTGHLDSETGYLYLVNRTYDPKTGQFTSIDPVVALTGIPFGYAGNDPLNTTDPLGLWDSSDTGMAVGTLMGVGLVVGAGACLLSVVCGAAAAGGGAVAVAGVAIADVVAAGAMGAVVGAAAGLAASDLYLCIEGDNSGAAEGGSGTRPPGNAGQLPRGGEFRYEAPKGASGGYTKLPGNQGILDKYGNIWRWARPGAQHGGPHWDVQLEGGGYKNVYPDGNVR